MLNNQNKKQKNLNMIELTKLQFKFSSITKKKINLNIKTKEPLQSHSQMTHSDSSSLMPTASSGNRNLPLLPHFEHLLASLQVRIASPSILFVIYLKSSFSFGFILCIFDVSPFINLLTLIKLIYLHLLLCDRHQHASMLNITYFVFYFLKFLIFTLIFNCIIVSQSSFFYRKCADKDIFDIIIYECKEFVEYEIAVHYY